MSWEVWTMKSRTSCSEMSLFRRCLQRYWPFWLGMAAVMVLFYVLPLANMLSDPSRPQVASGNLGPVQIFVYGHMDTCLLYALLFGLIAAMLVFEHTYSTKLTGLFASLPVKRGRLFWQHWLAGAVMLLSTGLLIALALLAVEAVYGAADLPSALTFLAVWSMESLTFYGIAAFCVMLTGHVLVIPALYLLLNFAGSALNLMLGGLVTSYSYGVMNGTNGLEWLHTLSPVVRLMTECGQGFGPNGESTGFIGWGWVIGYFIVGMIFTALALWLVDRSGRKTLLKVGTLGMVIALAGVATMFLFIERGMTGQFAGWMTVAGIALFVASFSVGPGVVVWLALSELMPGRIRANGMAIALFVNQMVAFTIADAFLPWQKACGYSVVFYSLAFFAFLYFLTAAFLLPETKGRTLEEIEKMWEKR